MLFDLPADDEGVFLRADTPFEEVPGTGALVIGRDLEAAFALHPDGRVVATADDRTWLVNSSLVTFKRSVEYYSAWRARAREITDDGDPHIFALRSQLADLDASALSDPASYWSEICEQVEDGLL